MGLLGPTKQDIKKAIKEAIEPKTSFHTAYYARAYVRDEDETGSVKRFIQDFPMSDVAFEKSRCRKVMYESIVDWFGKTFATQVINDNGKLIVKHPCPKLEQILIASKTDNSIYYPLSYKTENTEGELITVCTVDSNTLKETWIDLKPTNIEELVV